MDNLIVIVSILYGFYNCFSEISIRLENLTWRYDLYYLVPIRGHFILWLVSIFLIFNLCFYKKRINKFLKLTGLWFNLLFIFLWIDTIMKS